MQPAQQTQYAPIDNVRIDFMDAYSEVFHKECEMKKKSKAKKRFEARRAIEAHQEEKRLREALANWWDDI